VSIVIHGSVHEVPVVVAAGIVSQSMVGSVFESR